MLNNINLYEQKRTHQGKHIMSNQEQCLLFHNSDKFNLLFFSYSRIIICLVSYFSFIAENNVISDGRQSIMSMSLHVYNSTLFLKIKDNEKILIHVLEATMVQCVI